MEIEALKQRNISESSFDFSKLEECFSFEVPVVVSQPEPPKEDELELSLSSLFESITAKSMMLKTMSSAGCLSWTQEPEYISRQDQSEVRSELTAMQMMDQSEQTVRNFVDQASLHDDQVHATYELEIQSYRQIVKMLIQKLKSSQKQIQTQTQTINFLKSLDHAH